jgi:hypothetical protein
MDARPPLTPTGGRWFAWSIGPNAHRRVMCPHGHHIPCNSIGTEAHFARCTAYVAGGPRRHDCDEWVAVLRFRGGGTLTVSVSREEADEYAADHVTPAALLDALGIFDQLKRGA